VRKGEERWEEKAVDRKRKTTKRNTRQANQISKEVALHSFIPTLLLSTLPDFVNSFPPNSFPNRSNRFFPSSHFAFTFHSSIHPSILTFFFPPSPPSLPPCPYLFTTSANTHSLDTPNATATTWRRAKVTKSPSNASHLVRRRLPSPQPNLPEHTLSSRNLQGLSLRRHARAATLPSMQMLWKHSLCASGMVKCSSIRMACQHFIRKDNPTLLVSVAQR
jgi:hypothetical protein